MSGLLGFTRTASIDRSETVLPGDTIWLDPLWRNASAQQRPLARPGR